MDTDLIYVLHVHVFVTVAGFVLLVFSFRLCLWDYPMAMDSFCLDTEIVNSGINSGVPTLFSYLVECNFLFLLYMYNTSWCP